MDLVVSLFLDKTEVVSPRPQYGLGLVEKDFAFLTYGLNTLDMNFWVKLKPGHPDQNMGLV